jgi:transposase-like protein
MKFRGVIRLEQTDWQPPKFCPACHGRLQRAEATSIGSRNQRFFCSKCGITVTFDGVSGATSVSRLEIAHK